MASLDVHKLLKPIGGPAVVHSELRRHGIAEPSIKAVQKWFERGRISTDNLLDVLLLHRKLGNRINVLAYIRREPSA